MSGLVDRKIINPPFAPLTAAQLSTWGRTRTMEAGQSFRLAELRLSEPRDVTLYLGPWMSAGSQLAQYRASVGVGGSSMPAWVTPDVGPALPIMDADPAAIVVPRVGVALHFGAQEAQIDVLALAAGQYSAFCSLGRPTRQVVTRLAPLVAPAPDADSTLVRIPPFAVDVSSVVSAANAGATLSQLDPSGTVVAGPVTLSQLAAPMPISPQAWWCNVTGAAAEPATLSFGVIS